ILESCPHYFLWDASIYEKEKGYLFTMTPPLRQIAEKELLKEEWQSIDIIATDHCPFNAELKNKAFTAEIPMGVGGVQHAFTVMYERYGMEIIPKFTEKPAKAHGLYPQKGTLMPGADADIVIFDDTVRYTHEEEGSIYHQVPMKGKVEKVFLRGQTVVENGQLVGGKGQYLERRLV
ncbi:MAG: amidohydrolase family protein, partial [Clostridia bacterium]|nr:amidohydrolase family protein [Clostridia bacterium]